MRFSEEEISKIITDTIFELSFKKTASEEEALVETGILSSITVVELAVELEKTFSVSISFMEINKENFNTLSSIKNLMKNKLSNYK